MLLLHWFTHFLYSQFAVIEVSRIKTKCNVVSTFRFLPENLNKPRPNIRYFKESRFSGVLQRLQILAR